MLKHKDGYLFSKLTRTITHFLFCFWSFVSNMIFSLDE